jgi:hypothetical protein
MTRSNHYLGSVPTLDGGESIDGPYRVLELHGRRGIHPLSIHTSIRLGDHPLAGPRGTVRLWFFGLEDLAASFIAPHMAMDNPHFCNYAFLSDCPTPRDYGNSSFFFGWFRQNELRAQFFRGSIHREGFTLPQKAWVQAVPFNEFDMHRWYQVAFTWDDAAEEMRLYVNGVLVGVNDRFHLDFHRETPGETLFAGCPALCHGEVELFDEVLDAGTIYDEYRRDATDYDPVIERRLRKMFEGVGRDRFAFTPGDDWSLQLDLGLRDPADVDAFYLQGETGSVKPGAHADGLLVETPDVTFEPANRARQVYLWTERMFEGNLYVELDWQTLRPGGLALLMTQATGMSREDFMADYPRKTSGRMDTVHGENVRNYHWEFYRQMHDVRNDVATAFSRKNPFAFRNGFGSSAEPVEPARWYRLQYLQVGGSIRGAIDGEVLLEIEDGSRMNTGCVLTGGHVALRVMLHSRMLFRNLRVFTQRLPFGVIESRGPASADASADE